ncbi:MAG: dockerin type I domain-containing protein [Ruminococcus sp.]|nr:dockerin type I domain-containing protein [Ruminococcus sp.]
MKDWKKSLAVVSALAMMTTATASLNLNANAVTNDIYEFEDGTLDGATIYSGDRDGNAVDNASGDLVFLENGGETATVTVSVPETGMYNLTIATYTPYGDKTHNLLINDVDQGQISFVENTTGVVESALGMYKLNEGENTITIKSSWGWTYLDYIQVSDAEFPELSVEKTLSDSQATDETKRLMSFLVDNYGEHILSGQQEIYMYGPHDFEYEFEYIKELTGSYPAIRGFDFLNQANILYGSDDGTTDRMIDWANNKNGIVTASWHVTVPCDFENYELGVTQVDWSNATYVPSETDFDTAKVLEEGSKENLYYMACLESLASCIQELQDANVPIILRPLHEAEGSGGEDGSWFWWGKSGSAVYKELWKLTYETLTETYGLHNIIWEWNSYAYSTSADWYPGDEYVDIIAYDKYNCTDWSTGSAVLTHNDSAISGTFYNLVDMYPGKMVAMSENDSVPTLENLTSEKAGWLYFCPWYDGGSESTNFLTNPVFNVADDLKELYQSDYCINLEELPENLYTSYSLDGWGEQSPSTTETTVTTTVSESESTSDTTTSESNSTSDTTTSESNSTSDTTTSESNSTSDTTTSESNSTSDTTTSESSPTDTTTSETTIADGETLLGDVTCDGDIKSNDLLLLKKYLLGTEELSEQALKNADMTQDNDIKSNDLLLLKKVLLGIE